MNKPPLEQRIDIFEHARNTAGDLLNMPEIHREYGPRATGLEELIAASFPVDVVDGEVTIPEAEKDQDNIGVLALLPGEEVAQLDGSSYFGNLPPQDYPSVTPDTYLDAVAGSFSRYAQKLPTITGGAVHFSRTHGNAWVPTRERFRSRSLIVLTPQVVTLSEKVLGSLMSHEFDHAAFLRANVNARPQLYEAGNSAVHATMTERSAYLLGYSLLRHSGELDDMPTPEAIVEAVHEGRSIKELYDRDDPTNQERGFKLKPLDAKVLSLLLDTTVDEIPSKKEIITYQQFKLLHESS